jgi:DedD protein
LKAFNMQRDPSSDQELNLKKRARRRLVGAIALVLLMIIVLPMVLKDRAISEPKDKITITLPSEQQVVTPASDFDSTIVPAESSTTPQTKTVEPTEVEQAPDSEAAPVKHDKVAPAKETPVKEASNTKADPNHRFYVQIGVFSDASNVKQLQTKLSDLGYKSQTEKIGTDKGQKIRLRTQVFADRSEAAIALENIKDAGLTGMVVSQ